MIKRIIPKPYKNIYWYKVTLKHGALDGAMNSSIVEWMTHNQRQSRTFGINPPARFNLGSIQKVNSKPPFMNFYYYKDYESFVQNFTELISFTEEPYNQKHIDMWRDNANIIVQPNLLEHSHRYRFTFLCESAYMRNIPDELSRIIDIFGCYGLTPPNGYVLRAIDWDKINLIFSNQHIATYIKLSSPRHLLRYEKVVTPDELESEYEQ